jgi:hypothetical protein
MYGGAFEPVTLDRMGVVSDLLLRKSSRAAVACAKCAEVDVEAAPLGERRARPGSARDERGVGVSVSRVVAFGCVAVV